MALDQPVVRAPLLPSVDWLNAPEAPTLTGLRGQTVLIDFWDFTCVNCLRTLPVLRDWHERYRQAGLAMLGVHTPEFPFARDPRQVRAAVGRLGIRWPVALDNSQEVWTAFANHVWPSIYLIDHAGYLRFRREGEGAYVRTEESIRALLTEAGLDPSALPPVGSDSSDEPGAGAACLPATPELHAESLGNGPVEGGKPRSLFLPPHRPEGSYYLAGDWQLVDQGMSLVSETGEAVLPFQASAVHAVLSPFAGAETPAAAEAVSVEAWIDDAAIPSGHFGKDLFHRQGSTWVQVEVPRLYEIAVALDPGLHELRLRCASPGWSVYAFSFQACLDPAAVPRSSLC